MLEPRHGAPVARAVGRQLNAHQDNALGSWDEDEYEESPADAIEDVPAEAKHRPSLQQSSYLYWARVHLPPFASVVPPALRSIA